MQHPYLAVLCALGAVFAAALANAQPRPRSTCFRTEDVTAWRPVGARAVNLQVRYRETYRLDFAYPCDALRFAGERIGFRKVTPGPVCAGLDVDVRVRGMTCPVQTIRKLSAAEVTALPRKQRP